MKIYLFTNSFPFGKSEPFLQAELEVASKIHGIEIELVPFIIEGELRTGLPKNIEINTSLNDSYKRHFEGKIWPIFKSIPQIIKGVIQHKVTSSSALRDVVGFSHHGKIVCEWAMKHIKDHNALLYCYWFERVAFGLSLFQKKSRHHHKIISRAHGYDVYDRLRPHGFIPYRRQTIQQMDQVYFISSYGQYYFVNSYGFENKTSVARLGTFKLLDKENPEGKKVKIVSCSSAVAVKRLDLILATIAKLTQILDQVEWVHIGDGPLLEKIKVEHQLELKEMDVKFLGHQPNEAIHSYYTKNHVSLFINLSDSEGIPVSMMECISYGIQVISRGVGGLAEIVNETTGYLLPEEIEPELAAQKIKNLIEQPKSKKEIIDFFVQNFEAKQNFEAFYSLLIA